MKIAWLTYLFNLIYVYLTFSENVSVSAVFDVAFYEPLLQMGMSTAHVASMAEVPSNTPPRIDISPEKVTL